MQNDCNDYDCHSYCCHNCFSLLSIAVSGNKGFIVSLASHCIALISCQLVSLSLIVFDACWLSEKISAKESLPVNMIFTGNYNKGDSLIGDYRDDCSKYSPALAIVVSLFMHYGIHSGRCTLFVHKFSLFLWYSKYNIPVVWWLLFCLWW